MFCLNIELQYIVHSNFYTYIMYYNYTYLQVYSELFNKYIRLIGLKLPVDFGVISIGTVIIWFDRKLIYR